MIKPIIFELFTHLINFVTYILLKFEYMEHGFKDVAFYIQKHIALLAVCYNFPLVRDKPLGVSAFVRLVYCLTSPFVPNLEAESVVPKLTIRDSDNC